MAVIQKKIYCTFPKDRIREPILYNIGREFQVIPNIHGASISDDLGLVFLELEGESDEVDRAVTYLVERGVKVDDVEGEPPPEFRLHFPTPDA